VKSDDSFLMCESKLTCVGWSWCTLYSVQNDFACVKVKIIISVTSPCTFVRWHMLDYSRLRKAAIIMVYMSYTCTLQFYYYTISMLCVKARAASLITEQFQPALALTA